jgi:uncharacterized protein (TIGR03435 family)
MPFARISKWARGAIAALALMFVGGAIAAPLLQTQSPPVSADQPKFDVVSIKPNKPSPSGPLFMFTGMEAGGRLIDTGVDLRTLIAQAYQLKPAQEKLISGLPGWAKSVRFDVEAHAEGNPSREQMRLMLQSLLADRFGLAIHSDTRKIPLYALELAKAGKTGLQLQPHSEAAVCLKLAPGQPIPRSDFGVVPPPPPACGEFISGARRLAGNNVTIAMLAENLSGLPAIDRPIIDRTHLGGTFDLELSYDPDLGLPDSPASQSQIGPTDVQGPPPLPSALREELGLKLQSTSGPVNLLVIDRVEEPIPN